MQPSKAPRAVALDLLSLVLDRRRPFDEALAQHADMPRMEPRDRAFVRLSVATVLRRLGQIDEMIARRLERPLPDKAANVQHILRIGVAQLIFMKAPPHAAVSEAVKLAEKRAPSFKGLVNAVLRRISVEGHDLVAAQDAGRLNTPDFLWDSWVAAYGEATARAIGEANMTEAALDLTVHADPEAWAERLEARALPTGTLRRPAGGFVAELPGFAEGAWWVQDLAASLPAKILGDVAGLRIVDLCAAPGGKTLQLAAAGARVTAVDLSPKRLEKLAANLARIGLSAETAAADAGVFDADEPFDVVLLDAPCSATGTIRRHPDIPRLKTPNDVARLTETQARLLGRATELVKPGGLLIYCTCSIERVESEAQVDLLLESDDRFERVPIRAEEIGGMAEILNDRGEIRSLPCHLQDLGGIDGFFVARLRRKG